MRPAWRIVNVGTPGAGSGFSHVVPGAVVQRVAIVSFTLHNAAAAADRRAIVTFTDGSGVSFGSFGASVVTQTGVTTAFVAAIGIQDFGALNGPHIGFPLPDVLLEVGTAVVVTVDAMNPADQITDPRLYVEQIGVQPERDNTGNIMGPSSGDWTLAPVVNG